MVRASISLYVFLTDYDGESNEMWEDIVNGSNLCIFCDKNKPRSQKISPKSIENECKKKRPNTPNSLNFKSPRKNRTKPQCTEHQLSSSLFYGVGIQILEKSVGEKNKTTVPLVISPKYAFSSIFENPKRCE